MKRARLYQQGKPATQAGRARAGRYVLEFEGQSPRRPDPLMGWAGGGDTDEQVRLVFPTLEAALAYCTRQGIEPDIVPPSGTTLILKSYAENFR